MNSKSVKPFVQIIGGGLAGWSAAAMLSKELAGVADIRIDTASDTNGPELSSYSHAVLEAESIYMSHSGLDVEEMIKAGKGGFSLGTCFEKWDPKGRNIFHAPGEALPANDGVAVHQILRRISVQDNNDALFADLYLPLAFQGRMAAAGKFSPPSQDRQSPRSLLRPAIHMDGAALTAIMRRAALSAGVSEKSGEEENALIVVDCRHKDQPGTIEDNSNLFGFDRCMTAYFHGPVPQPPYDIVRAADDALITIMPLQNGAILSLLYSSAAVDDPKAANILSAALGGGRPETLSVQSCIAGRANTSWNGNRILLGTSAMQLGPISGTDVKLLAMQLETLAGLLPRDAGDDLQHKSAEYNRKVNARFDHYRDFLHLPLVRNNFAGPYWAALRDQNMSSYLERRLAQFERRGVLVLIDDDPFEKHVWLEMMIGLAITPNIYDRAADGINIPAKMGELGQMVVAFDQTIAAMPSHEEFIAEMNNRSGL